MKKPSRWITLFLGPKYTPIIAAAIAGWFFGDLVFLTSILMWAWMCLYMRYAVANTVRIIFDNMGDKEGKIILEKIKKELK